MSRGEPRGLMLVGVKLEPEDFAVLEAYAQRNGLSMGAAGRRLIVASLRGENEALDVVDRELKSRERREALREVAHKVKETLTAIFKEDL